MNKAVLIIGLPGSGKTYLANTKYVPLGYILIDDPSNNEESYQLLNNHLTITKNDVVITDPQCCNESIRISCIRLLKLLGYTIECIYFENCQEKSKKLIELRNDGRIIKTFQTFNYTIPENIIPLKIYEPK